MPPVVSQGCLKFLDLAVPAVLCPIKRSLPPGTVRVVWDHGVTQNYRVGYSGAYDLRLLDNGSSGVYHNNTSCSQCQQSPIYGIRWSCSVCSGVQLCSRCYMSNVHDTHHSFIRHVVDGDPGVGVAERARDKLTDTLGTYPGAVVTRNGL